MHRRALGKCSTLAGVDLGLSMAGSETAETQKQGVDRRAALKRLGLATAVAYAMPSMLKIDRSANAQVLPSFCPPPGSPIPPPPGCEFTPP